MTSLQLVQRQDNEIAPFSRMLLLGGAIFSGLCGAQQSPATPKDTVQAPARVDMGDFSIDQTEVSVGRFAEYAKRRQVVTAAEKRGVASSTCWVGKSAPAGLGKHLSASLLNLMSQLFM